MRKVSLYVATIASIALAASGWLYLSRATPGQPEIEAVIFLSVLAVVAEALAFKLPQSASGTVAFIPYLAAVLVSPSWLAVIPLACLRCAREIIAHRGRLKVVFNTASFGLAQAIAVSVYLGLGGSSILALPHNALLGLTLAVGAPAVVAFSLALLAHSILVSIVIGLSAEKPVWEVWKLNHAAIMLVDLAAGPLVFVFGWVYAAFGPLAAAALWVPVLGLRQVHIAGVELAKVNQELLELMVKSIEARDPYTSGHSRRVQHYSAMICRAIGLGERDIKFVSRAALLHDIGKIYEKYAPILSKPDALSTDEWATMKEHPVDGANLVATMSRFHDVVPAIRHHHENWDGTGYPEGLAGEKIPLAARVIMFADTIDAMTSERPYRRPLGEPQVRAEIVRCRGKQFDPQIADVLLSSPLWKSLFASPAILGTPHQGLRVIRPESKLEASAEA